MGLFSRLSVDIGIDLGTCNTLVYVSGRGIICSEPSVVAIRRGTNEIVSVGEGAKRMLSKTPVDILALRPLRNGVIADIEMTEVMIRYFVERAIPRRPLVQPRMVIGIPSCITQVERKAVKDSARRARSCTVEVIEESLAAAIGADIPIHEPAGHMICDVGGGTTEISVISLGGMVISNAIRLGGDSFDQSIIKYVRSIHNLIIGEPTAEQLKINIGSAFAEDTIHKMEIKGIDAITGLPRRLEIDSVEIREALQEPVNVIVEELKKTLGQTPPELVADIAERGIVMTGGGAMLKGFANLLAKETGVPVIIAEDPLNCVAIGTGKYYEYKKKHDTPI